jgi:hypothetical protein
MIGFRSKQTINLAKLNKIQLVKILFTTLGWPQLLTISQALFIHKKIEINERESKRKSYNSFEQ